MRIPTRRQKTSEKGDSYTSEGEDARRPRGGRGLLIRDTSCEAYHQAELSRAGGPREPPPPKPPPPWAALPERFDMPWRASLPP